MSHSRYNALSVFPVRHHFHWAQQKCIRAGLVHTYNMIGQSLPDPGSPQPWSWLTFALESRLYGRPTMMREKQIRKGGTNKKWRVIAHSFTNFARSSVTQKSRGTWANPSRGRLQRIISMHGCAVVLFFFLSLDFILSLSYGRNKLKALSVVIFTWHRTACVL